MRLPAIPGLQVQPRLAELAAAEAIVIVGATCVGKTTLTDAVRRAAIAGVEVPVRYVTRPARPDDTSDNVHVAAMEFARLVEIGSICVRWSRTLRRTEQYGFAATSLLPVYSANDSIYRGSIEPAGALDRALLVGIHAPDEVRALRLSTRSPELWRDHPDEARLRLAEAADAMLPHVHAVIENTERVVAERALLELVKVLASARP